MVWLGIDHGCLMLGKSVFQPNVGLVPNSAEVFMWELMQFLCCSLYQSSIHVVRILLRTSILCLLSDTVIQEDI